MQTTKRTKLTRHESTAASRPPKSPPTEDEIRQRAHYIFLARGSVPGRDLDNWLEAERQIFRERIEEFEQQDK